MHKDNEIHPSDEATGILSHGGDKNLLLINEFEKELKKYLKIEEIHPDDDYRMASLDFLNCYIETLKLLGDDVNAVL